MMNKIPKHLGVGKLLQRGSQLIAGQKGQLHPICTHSCVFLHQNKLWLLGLGYMWGNYSSPHETEHMFKKIENMRKPNCPIGCFPIKSCANAIEAFHRTLGGHTFRHQKQENGDNVACPIASIYIIGLGPSHTNPQFNPIKQENKPKLPHIFEHIPTIQSTKRRSKYTNGKLESLRMEYLLVGDE